jgi:hypothetical protein
MLDKRFNQTDWTLSSCYEQKEKENFDHEQVKKRGEKHNLI